MRGNACPAHEETADHQNTFLMARRKRLGRVSARVQVLPERAVTAPSVALRGLRVKLNLTQLAHMLELGLNGPTLMQVKI